MSHSHRDEHELAEPLVDDAAPVTVVPPAPVVANSEAERRAAERRKADGVLDQTTEHQFTGDLPEPSRGGTETETRIRLRDEGDEEDARSINPAAARRGPPPPRAQLVEDEHSWAAPPGLDALSSGAVTADESWLAPTSDSPATAPADVTTWAADHD